MKNFYFTALLSAIIFLAAGRAEAACPVNIVPGGQVVFCTGDSVDLIAASGTGYTYQWKRNNISIAGATAQFYYAKISGTYTVTVTVISPACTSTSNPILVTAEVPLTVSVTEPFTNFCGASTDLLEVSPTGTGFLYQWFEDTIALPSTNNYQYSTGHNGNYICTITNTCGSFSSPTYVLNYPTFQFMPYGVIVAGGSTSFCSGGSVNLALDQSQIFFNLSGVQWFKDGVAIPGANNYNYTATTAGTYGLRLTDYCWQSFTYYDFYTNWIVVSILPGSFPIASISAGGPTSFCQGSNVALTATTGAGYSYQWQLNGVNIAGATASVYNAGSAGTYACVVTNGCGSIVSNSIITTVTPTAVTINPSGTMTICTGSTMNLTATSAGTGGTYQWKLNGSNIAGATNATYTTGTAGIITCAISNSCGTFVSNTLTLSLGTCATGLQFDGSNDFATVPNNAAYAFGSNNFTIEAWVTLDPIQGSYPTVISQHNSGSYYAGYWMYFSGGRMYFVLAGNFAGGGYGPDLRDNLCHHVAVTRTGPNALNYYIDGTLVGTYAVPNYNETANGVVYLGRDLYYSSSYLRGKLMEVRLWNVGRTLAEIQGSRNASLNGNEAGLVGYYRLDDGTGQVINDYSPTINDGQLGSTASADVNDPVFQATCPLSGCTLPIAAITAGGPTAICAGGSVMLNANTGAGLSYQWKLDGNNLAGATAASYLASVAGNYTCFVTNSCGSITSNTIAVSINPASVTISTTGATTICTGNSTLLNASSAGSTGTYQWVLNGTNISGATASSYAASAAGNFTCSITNSCGTFISNAIVITVLTNCNYGLQFDGSNDRVTINDHVAYHFGSGDFSAEAWIKADASQSVTFPIIISKRLTASSGFILFLSNGRLAFQVGGINMPSLGNDLRDNVCHHVAVSRGGGTVNFYVDGALVSTQTGFNQDVTTTHNLWIGNDEPSPNAFKGLIHEVRLWNVARTQAQFVAAKDTFLQGNETGLIGYWKLNEGSGQQATDNSTMNNGGYLGSLVTPDINDPTYVNSCYLTCALPAATITAGGPTTFCSGGSVTLNANTGAGLTYQWKLNSNNINGATSSSYLANAGGTYTCVVTNGCGSTISNGITVTIQPLPTASITNSGSTTICTGSFVTLNANTGTGLTYQWKLNTNNIGGATSASYNATSGGNYTCVVTNSCGSITSNVINVTEITVPTAIISAGGSTTICIGNTVLMSANGGAGFTFQWTLNGGNIPGATSSSYAATTAGTYACVVSNTCGSATSNTISITVTSLPTASISAGGSTTFCTGGSVLLSANTGTGLSYQWKLNGGNIGGATTSTYTANATGSYRCTVSNSCGSANSDTINVNVLTAPAATITAGGNTTFCAGGFVTLNANIGSGFSYQWKLNSVNITGANASSHNASATGSYTCMVTNACGSTTSNAITVTVNPAPPAIITAAGSTTVCAGSQVVINANTGTGLTYQWKWFGTIINGATSPTYFAGTAGDYSCIVTNACGSTTSNTITIVINPQPTASINAGGSTTFCTGGSVLLSANTGTGLSYQWTLNSANINGATAATYMVSATGNYACVVTNSCGSITSNAIAVSVDAPPVANIIALGSTTICAGDSVLLEASSGTGYTYQYQFNGVNMPGQISMHCPAFNAGNYTCIVSNACGSVTTNTITISVVTGVPAVITASGPTTICAGSTVTLNANTGAGLTYQWRRGNVDITGATDSSYTTGIAGNYSCVVTSNCSSYSNSILVTILNIPATPGAISGLTSGVCGIIAFYSITPVPGATVYTWTLPPGASFNNGQGTTTAAVSFPVSFTGGVISVTAGNSCGISSSRSLSITNALLPPGPISGPTAVCELTTYVYSIASVPGATSYQWTIPVKARIVSGAGTPTVTVKIQKFGGYITVTASNACTTSTTRIIPVTITTVNCAHVHREDRMLDAEVYPNPASNFFTLNIVSAEDEKCTFIVRDMTGRELERREEIAPGTSIQFGEHLASGIYFAEVIQGEDRIVVRVVKNE